MKTVLFKEKFAEKDLDEFIDQMYHSVSGNPQETYTFDLTNVRWISNQELLVFTGLLKYLLAKEISFRVLFIKPGTALKDVPRRVALQIIQIWEVWKIWAILPNKEYTKYFGIDVTAIQGLKALHKISSQNNEIYNRYNITPFLSLDKIENYNDREIDRILEAFYKLNAATQEIVRNNHCEHPFVNSTLGSIITKELYENFLDHFSSSFFKSTENWAFMSLSLKGELKAADDKTLQSILEGNFDSESLPETRSFFYDEKNKKFRNRPYLQFSFLDFGEGIVETLIDQYKVDLEKKDLLVDHSDVLKYSFDHSSSRHPINDRYNKRDEYIPRGLFDLLSVVKRYSGLMIARSNFGKIIYDFSGDTSMQQSFKTFGRSNLYFPGTLISIYLPATRDQQVDNSAIKPIYEKPMYKSETKVHIDIYHIINRLLGGKKDLYSNLLGELRERLKNKTSINRTIYLTFRGYERDTRLTKKVLFFLLTDYEINSGNSVIILHPPSLELLRNINNEILELSAVIKNFKIHPLPFIFLNDECSDVNLFWLGIYNEDDKSTLNNLLYEDFPLSRTDLTDPNNTVGNTNYFDRLGNLKSSLPNRQELLDYYVKESYNADSQEVLSMIDSNHCLPENQPAQFYLCNGNYYQYSFIEISRLLNNSSDCNLISEILWRRVQSRTNRDIKYKYAGITSSSHKIIESLIRQGYVLREDVCLFENYHTFNNDENFSKLSSSYHYILVCDAIATGSLTTKLKDRLLQIGSSLDFVAVIANTIDNNFERSGEFLSAMGTTLISLYDFKIEKFRRTHQRIRTDIKTHEIIRINPFTNTPITLSVNETNYLNNILISNRISFDEQTNMIRNQNYFLDQISEEDIKIGYLKYNNLIHPYFFDTVNILKSIDFGFLTELFKQINLAKEDLHGMKIFYPKNSGISFLDFEELKNKVFADHSVAEYVLERFNTKEGWKFPHTGSGFSKIVKNSTVLILDDGSCSGDSLMQMVDEVAVFDIRKIVVLSFVGRINDHRREFISKIKSIKTGGKIDAAVEIYFASHWHIPTFYLEENPISIEKKWMLDVSKIQNVPISVRRIAQKIAQHIDAKGYDPHVTQDIFRDYRYLPKIRNTENFPKKEILLVREEIGKIIGYRFYKENFAFFDLLIKKYESPNRTNLYKEIELLCAAFIFEPYLYDRIREVVPDVVARIEDFVRALIFGNAKNEVINLEDELFYAWSRKDIIHLFFIVFTNEKLVSELSSEKLLRLIKFSEPTESNLNYIFYRLLRYFPLTKEDLAEKKFTSKILDLLSSISSSDGVSSSNHIKKFISFLLSLPSDENFNHQLLSINEEYDKILKEKYHDTNIISFLDTLSIKLAFLNNLFDDGVVREIEDNWGKASRVIEKVLSFKSKFPEFFLILTKDDQRVIESFRAIHGEAAGKIYGITRSSNFKDIDTLVSEKIREIFVKENCIFKIFSNPRCKLEPVLVEFVKQIQKKYSNANVSHNIVMDKETVLLIPEYIFSDVLLYEIVQNFRYCDFSKPILIHVAYQSSNEVMVEIRNKFTDATENKGSGIGSERLTLINSYPGKNISYSSKKETPNFQQTIAVKTN